MNGVPDARHSDTLRVDHATLKVESVGNDNTRYRVCLTGPVGDQWALQYRAIQADSTEFRRFRLDAPARSLSFSCRTIEGPSEVMEILERLEALIETVNRSLADGPTSLPKRDPAF